jgi:mRNA guanylyltransferase
VPDVPGFIVDEQHAVALRGKVQRICGLNHNRFPGAQPVSFTTESLNMLKDEE